MGNPQRFYPTLRRTFARVVPNDDAQAGALVEDMLAHGFRRVAVIDDGRVYGDALAKRFSALASARGLRTELIDAGDGTPAGDSATLNSVRMFGSRAMLFAGTTSDDAVRFAVRAYALAPSVALFGPAGLARPSFYRRVEQAAPATYVTAPELPPRFGGPYVARFRSLFRARLHRERDPSAVYGYAAMELVLASLRRAGPHANDRRAVVRALHALGPRADVLGRYAIDARGDTTQSRYASYRVIGGRL